MITRFRSRSRHYPAASAIADLAQDLFAADFEADPLGRFDQFIEQSARHPAWFDSPIPGTNFGNGFAATDRSLETQPRLPCYRG